MSDHSIWANDILNRNSTYSVAHVTSGSLTVATATLTSDGSYVNKSSADGSVYVAYKDLAERLSGGLVLIPWSTTTQRDALTSVETTTFIYNITNSRLEFYSGSAWVSSGGSSSGSTVAFGAMYQDNSSGDAISATTSYVGWVTASAGVFDSGALCSFTGNGTADRLTVETGGAGVYMIEFHCNVTNSGGKLTTAAIHVNGVEQESVKMSLTGDSSKAVHLASGGPLTLADDDFVDLRFKSESSDTVTVYQANVNIDRIEVT